MDIYLNLNKDTIDNRIYNNEHCSIYLIGDYLGQITENDQYVEDLDLESVIYSDCELFIENLKTKVKSSIGKFCLIVERDNKFCIINSFSAPGIYILHDKGIIITTNEKVIFNKYINDVGIKRDFLNDYLGGNHLSFRHPFSFFGQYIRIPGGHYTSWFNADNIDGINITSILNKYKHELNDFQLIDKLHKRLSIILKSYEKLYKGGVINLAFSGGLDSSILMAILKDNGQKFNSYFIEYNGKNNIDSLLAHQVANYLGEKITFVPGASKKITDDQFDRHMDAGFFQLNNLKYIYNSGINCYYMDQNIIITGQNADSLYSIDTFLPGTEMVGVKRIENIISTTKLRLAYNESIFVDIKQITDINLGMIKNIAEHYFLNIENEHIYLDKNYEKNLESLKLLKKDRYDKIFPKLFGQIEDFADGRKFISILRYIKTLRNNINTSQNYNEMGRFIGLNRLCPFNEGPIYELFINYQIKHYDVISPKTIFEILFNKITNLSHRNIVEGIIIKKVFNSNGPILNYDGDIFSNDEFKLKLNRISGKINEELQITNIYKEYMNHINQNPARFLNLITLIRNARK